MNALAIFDLDDTLIDTQGVLLRPALERVARIVGAPVESLDHGGKKIDEVLAPLGALSADVRTRAAEAWYDPAVPPLEPLPGAREALAALRGDIHLALLTRGDPVRQQAKVDRCGLRDAFDVVRVRVIEEPGSKRDDIVELARQFGVPLARTVVIGDDPRDEIRHARDLGCPVLPVPENSLLDIPARIADLGLVVPH